MAGTAEIVAKNCLHCRQGFGDFARDHLASAVRASDILKLADNTSAKSVKVVI